jgi:hypothetical protein
VFILPIFSLQDVKVASKVAFLWREVV